MKTVHIFFFLVLALGTVSCSTGNDNLYLVSVTVAPDGAGTITPSAEKFYEKGTIIHLRADGNERYQFDRWTGDQETTRNPLPLIVDRDFILTAHFTSTENLFDLHENGTTILCPGVKPGKKGMVNGTEYEAVDRTLLDQKRDGGEDLSLVCTSPVTDMGYLFDLAEDFNQDISTWDVSNVTDMSSMFHGAVNFNRNLNHWDVSSVTSMRVMFWGADNFDQDLNNWNVSSVTDMLRMFSGDSRHGSGSTSFNGDISDWDVENVTEMGSMFSNAASFNQDLSGWCVPDIPEEQGCFACGSALSEEHYPVWGTCPQ